jgi:hypothetical protein
MYMSSELSIVKVWNKHVCQTIQLLTCTFIIWVKCYTEYMSTLYDVTSINISCKMIIVSAVNHPRRITLHAYPWSKWYVLSCNITYICIMQINLYVCGCNDLLWYAICFVMTSLFCCSLTFTINEQFIPTVLDIKAFWRYK